MPSTYQSDYFDNSNEHLLQLIDPDHEPYQNLKTRKAKDPKLNLNTSTIKKLNDNNYYKPLDLSCIASNSSHQRNNCFDKTGGQKIRKAGIETQSVGHLTRDNSLQRKRASEHNEQMIGRSRESFSFFELENKMAVMQRKQMQLLQNQTNFNRLKQRKTK